MGTLENLSVLAEELRGTRERLEAIADRAAEVRTRLSANASTILSLDKLTNERRPPRGPHVMERFEGEAGSLESDAWEISLINEEG